MPIARTFLILLPKKHIINWLVYRMDSSPRKRINVDQFEWLFFESRCVSSQIATKSIKFCSRPFASKSI